MVLVLVLPFLFVSFGFSVSSDNIRKYRSLRLTLLNFLHRIGTQFIFYTISRTFSYIRAGYTLILDVALYAAFRQRRPCSCPVAVRHQFTLRVCAAHLTRRHAQGHGYVQVGSLYGSACCLV
jgi:hypothetical protein